MQKETYFVGVPCITLRDETEWPETVSAGANIVVGADRDKIISAANRALDTNKPQTQQASGPFGDGQAGRKIVDLILKA